jgi:hypothetical protein
MARHFGAQHTASGFSAMGGSLLRPRYPMAKNRSVREAIAHAARVHANMQKAGKKK